MQANGVQQQTRIINTKGMKAELYRAAITGSFEAVSSISNWVDQHTPTENNILHLHVGKPFHNMAKRGSKPRDPYLVVSKEFIDKVLDGKPLDPYLVVSKEFIDKVLDGDDGYKLLWRQNSNRDTPLHLAARFGHDDAVEAFLERAEKENNQEEVTKLLKMTNEKKDTALHEAARAGHAGVVKLLVEAVKAVTSPPSINFHEPNEDGETPLYLAAERGSTPSVLSILETCNAQDLAFKGPCGRTALHAAVQWGDSEMVSKMLENDESLARIQNDEGLTPVHCVAAEINKVELLKILLQNDNHDNGSSALYIQDNKGRTALHITILRKNWYAIESIVNSVPDSVEIVDNKGQNVLHYAAKWTCLRIMEYLMVLGRVEKLINDKDVDGNTPLHLLSASIPDAFPRLHPCLSGLNQFVKNNPSIDLKVFNKQNLTVGDILLSLDSLLTQELRLGLYKCASVARGRRVNDYERDVDVEKAYVNDALGEAGDDKETLIKAAQSRLVVSALIATVSFAAGFTVPGGFDQNNGPNMGMAVFKGKTSFKVFMISDAIAFITATAAILFYFLLVTFKASWVIQAFSLWALGFNTISAGAMVTAFLAAVYAVSSKGVSLTVGIICSAFYVFYTTLVLRTLRSSWIFVFMYKTGNPRAAR